MIGAFLALAAASAPAETPRAFLDRVYAAYRDESFSPLARPEAYFAGPLAAAIREDSRLSTGEVGFLDGDPLCQCQDYAGMVPAVRAVSPSGGGAATARIVLRLPGYAPRDVRLRLVRTRSGWRIADVGTAEAPSLLRDLQRSNRRRR